MPNQRLLRLAINETKMTACHFIQTSPRQEDRDLMSLQVAKEDAMRVLEANGEYMLCEVPPKSIPVREPGQRPMAIYNKMEHVLFHIENAHIEFNKVGHLEVFGADRLFQRLEYDVHVTEIMRWEPSTVRKRWKKNNNEEAWAY